MNGMNGSRRRLLAVVIGSALVLVLVWSLGSQTAAGSLPRNETALAAAHEQVVAPLKPDWVEALLDERATALRALLDARDLLSARPGPDLAKSRQRGAAPLKPDWVEALLDARAGARRARLEAHDLVTTPWQRR
jgi:hypothetical protein